jgi:hypothetical protein
VKATDLAGEMASRGFIGADADPLPFGATGTPWYVSAVLGTAGWLASLFAFLFVLLLFEPDTAAGIALAGIVMLGAGLGLYVADRDSAFFGQLALALSLAGQLGLIVAAAQATESASATAAFATLLAAVLVRTLPNHFARALSTFLACVSWALTVRFVGWGEVWFSDPDLSVGLVPALVGWIVIWAPVLLTAHALITNEPRWMASERRRIARPALTGLLVALSIGTWASQPFGALVFWAPAGEVPVNWLALWPLLGVATALFAAVCAFRLRHRPIIGLAVAGALLHLVQFYYLLGVSLAVKSYIMLGVGLVLLLSARRLRLGEPVPSATAASSGAAP